MKKRSRKEKYIEDEDIISAFMLIILMGIMGGINWLLGVVGIVAVIMFVYHRAR